VKGQLRLGVAILALAGWAAVSSAELPLEDRIQLADSLFEREMADLALKEYLALLREVPDRIDQPRILFQAAECFRQSSQDEVALGYYRRVAGLYPDSAPAARALYRMGELALAAGNSAEAIGHFQSAAEAKAAPGNLVAAARLMQARALGKAGRDAEAEALFLSILDKHPDSELASDAALEAGDLIRKAGSRAAAEAELYRRLILLRENEPAGLEARWRLADLAFREKRYVDAADACEALLRKAPDSPQARSARLVAAWSFLQTGRWAESARLAEEAIGEPGATPSAEWLYVLANARRQLKDSAKALEAYDRLLAAGAAGPFTEAAAYESALVAFHKGDAADAIRRATGWKPSGAMRGEVDWLLAEAYSAAGRTDEAVQHYRALMEAKPADRRAPEAAYRLGRVLQSRKAWLEAAEAFRFAAGAGGPEDLTARARHSAAFCLAEAGRHAEALTEWARLLQDFPKHPIGEDAQFRKALSEIYTDQPDVARETLRGFLDAWPQSRYAADARFWRGVLLEKAGRDADAEREYRAGLEASPGEDLRDRLRLRLAGVLQRQQRVDEAADLYQGLLSSPVAKEIPPPLLAWLARCQLERKRPDEADAAARRLIAVQEGDAASWQTLGWYLIGRVHALRGEGEQALAAFEQVAASTVASREPVEALVWAGDLHLESGRAEEARKRYETAVERSNGSNLGDLRVRALFGLGRVAQAAEAWEDAVRYYQSVALLFDDPVFSPRALQLAADGLKKLGREEEARKTLQELAERYPAASAP
jgi:tetratricopeptide (TPR) repeat protein